jgi:hypothetical protein
MTHPSLSIVSAHWQPQAWPVGAHPEGPQAQLKESCPQMDRPQGTFTASPPTFVPSHSQPLLHACPVAVHPEAPQA